MDVCFTIFAFRNKFTPGSAPILFYCSSSFRSEDAEIAEFVRCRMLSELLFDLSASLDGIFPSSLNYGLPGYFVFVEVFGIVSSAIDITVSLNFKI